MASKGLISNLKKTGLLPVSRPVEQILGLFSLIRDSKRLHLSEIFNKLLNMNEMHSCINRNARPNNNQL